MVNQKETTYNGDGSIDKIVEYEFYSGGYRKTEYNGDGSVAYIYEYEYNSSGKIIKETEYCGNSDGSVLLGQWNEYEYDNAGNLLKETKFDSYGNVDDCYEYEYNNDGKITKTTLSNAGLTLLITEYEYNSSGEKIKETQYDSTKKVTLWIEYEFDSAGNVTKEITHYNNGSMAGFEYEYGRDGKKTKKTRIGLDGNVAQWTEYEYNYEPLE